MTAHTNEAAPWVWTHPLEVAGVRMPYRVKVFGVTATAAGYRCPGCHTRTWHAPGRVFAAAHRHARRCQQLKALNWAVLACWNCAGQGLRRHGVYQAQCVVCYGRGWTTVPDSTGGVR